MHYISASLPTTNTQPARKSQRYIEVDDRLTNDMQVTESMQNFMHKKLNQILENRIEFVEIASPVAKDDPTVDSYSSVRLFRDSAPIVLEDPNTEPVEPAIKQKRHKKLKRRLASEDAAQSEADKLAASVVSEEDIKREVSAWKQRPKPHKHFEYAEHKYSKQLHLKEPDNEFTQMRKKNNWSENKIARK